MELTDAIYRASKPDAFQPLYTMNVGAERDNLAQSLHDQGQIIDRQIEMWGWSAPLTNAYRLQLGYSYAPSATFYAADVPKLIKASIDAVDYPPFHAPTPPHPAGSRVGEQQFMAGAYVIGPGFWSNPPKEGDPDTAPDGVAVTAHYGPSGIMYGWYWEDESAKAKRIAGGG